MLTRNERAVDEAKGSDGFRFADDELDVSPHYVLDDGTTPSDSVFAFLVAAGLGLLGGVILVGSVGGYLVFRRARDGAPEPATTLAPGDRLPFRVTGFIHTPYGRVHVREVPADLVRFILRPALAATEPRRAGDARDHDAGGRADRIIRTGCPSGSGNSSGCRSATW